MNVVYLVLVAQNRTCSWLYASFWLGAGNLTWKSQNPWRLSCLQDVMIQRPHNINSAFTAHTSTLFGNETGR